jgi:SAM-dependent methyltransferase
VRVCELAAASMTSESIAFGPGNHRVEIDELAVILRRLLRPDRLHRLVGLAHTLPRVVLHLILVPTPANSEQNRPSPTGPGAVHQGAREVLYNNGPTVSQTIPRRTGGALVPKSLSTGSCQEYDPLRNGGSVRHLGNFREQHVRATTMDLSTSWAGADFTKQWAIASAELDSLRNGKPPAVFGSFIALMKNYIEESENFKFLDCACTTGYYLDVIQIALKHNIRYTGSDLAQSAIELARVRHPSVDWRVASVTALPFQTKSFDIVMASGLLEHVPDWSKALEEITRVAVRYVVLHRLPISPSGRFLEGRMEMYGIPTTRFQFAYHEIIEKFSERGFVLINGIDTYHTHKIPEQTVLFKHRDFL